MSDFLPAFAARAGAYPLPDAPDATGYVSDDEIGVVLIVGFCVSRLTYHTLGFLCAGNAPHCLPSCVCALFELVQDMPIIATAQLTPEQLYEKLGTDMPSDEMQRCCAMALAALLQAYDYFFNTIKK